MAVEAKKRKKRKSTAIPPLPIGAVTDPELMQELEGLASELPGSFPALLQRLHQVEPFVEFDAALHQTNTAMEEQLESLLRSDAQTHRHLLRYAKAYLPPKLCVPICRRLAKSPDMTVRKRAQALARQKDFDEVALPTDASSWDYAGWSQGVEPGRLERHETGKSAQKAQNVPLIQNVGELRELLGIGSSKMLGFFLLSSELEDGTGPYTRFEISKRSGGTRPICAPDFQLKQVQRKILSQILDRRTAHDAAHGFVKERSIVTNAEVHKGRQILVKFDLYNFFPTIHYYRVMGYFASLGYHVGDGRFSSKDASENVAPVLARLTTYAPPGSRWGEAALPQGAPTSPSIANHICFNLDARLSGLAKRMGGQYTRYADDLTFSFDACDNLGRFRWWVDQICQQEGFVLNQHKYRVIRSSQRQMVTGIVVNETLRVPRKDRRRFRAILHNCRQHGVESQARGRPYFKGYLRGFASYIHMVHPEEGVKLLAEVKDLLEAEEAS